MVDSNNVHNTQKWVERKIKLENSEQQPNSELITKYGLTRQIKTIKDSIRKGRVLSVIEYVNLIDEIAKDGWMM